MRWLLILAALLALPVLMTDDLDIYCEPSMHGMCSLITETGD